MKKSIFLILSSLCVLLVACDEETTNMQNSVVLGDNTTLEYENTSDTTENPDNPTLDNDNSSNNSNNSSNSSEFDQTATHKVDNLDFGVGYGIKWEDGIFAPFADMGAWVTDPNYSNSGTLNLGQIMADTGIKYFNLGFINAVDNSVDENGVLNWGFGAYEVLSEDYADSNTQYQGIKKAISDVRANGGDVVISIGGLMERNFFQYSSDVDVLVNTYIEIIDGFNLTRIDLDIEGSSQGYDVNKINAQAIKIVQEKTDVEVVLTLPVLPTGLTENFGLPTLQVYIDEGVDIKAVNIMAMCYGSYFGDYADGSIDAIDSTMQQIKDCYANASITLSTEEAYNKVGVTTSIGFEGESHPIFTTDDSQTVVNYSISRNINFVSFWSLNRDSQTQDNKGIYSQYEHTKVYLDFEDDSIVIIPTEKEEILDDYEYTPDSSEYHMWSREEEANGSYITGYVVAYKGILYEQVSENIAWWCEPGTNENTWKNIGVDDTYTAGSIQIWSREIEETGAYTTGTLVIYKGKTYEQVSQNIAWWCEPGTDSSIWKLVD
ncbi:MAG: chitinase [Clostridia bacterium]